MKVTTLNLNGLRSAERRGFKSWLAKSKPDVLCLQEVRCAADVAPPNLWKPRGWKVAWNPAEKKGYSGTGVWTRHPSAAFSIGTGHARGDLEGRVVGAHLDGIDVYSCYLPSGSSGPDRQAWKMEFLDHVFPWLQARLASGRPTIVCGDLNIAHRPIDLKNWRSNQKNSGFLPEERAWMDQVLSTGWRDLWREVHPEKAEYSWWSNRGQARAKDVGWRIDYVLATPGVRVTDARIEKEADLSDHAPVSAWVDVG